MQAPIFHILPYNFGNAFQQMANDILLLENYPYPDAIRFRFYDWNKPSITFGYSQSYQWVINQLAKKEIQICRRPTGGGLVDHQNSWTYTLIIPASSNFYREKPSILYKYIHECLKSAMEILSISAKLFPCCNDPDYSNYNLSKDIAISPQLESHCFQLPSAHDVICSKSDEKIAGAALKRNKYGLLFQGTISKTLLEVDETKFQNSFTENLAALFETKKIDIQWPEISKDIYEVTYRQFKSPEWNEKR